jgi:hypothetical protein
MIEIDDNHKQILQYAVQAYYEDYLEMKKEQLEELKVIDVSLSEMRTILTLLGSPPEDHEGRESNTSKTQIPEGLVIKPNGTQEKFSLEKGYTFNDIGNHRISIPATGDATPQKEPPVAPIEQNPEKIEQQIPQQTPVPEQGKTDEQTEGVLHPDDLKQKLFEYDKTQMKLYEMIFFNELEDGSGRVVIEYSGAHYYTTKDNVMKIPYPFPAKYFSKKNGWSSTVEQAFRKYRKYLAEQDLAVQRQGTSVHELVESEQEKQGIGDATQSQSQLQKLKELAKPGITKEDLSVDWFECDPSQGKQIKGHENCKVVEMSDGRAMLQYKNGSHYYTSKEKVMKIPYPIPKGYFNNSGLSSNAEVCIRAYRHYLEIPQEMQEHDGDSGAQETEGKSEEVKEIIEEPETMEKPKCEFFKEDIGFDYISVNPQHIGGSTVYRSKTGKLVIKYQGKNTAGELLLTKDQDIEKLMDYDEKEVDWVIRSLSPEKRNVLRGYLRDLKAVNNGISRTNRNCPEHV